MTLSLGNRIEYTGDGSTVSFPFTSKIWAAGDLKVYLRDLSTLVDTLQVITTDYSVSVGAYPGTGNVIMTSAPASTKRVIIVRDKSSTQDLDLNANGAFAAENVEAALDKIVSMIQALEEQTGRSLLLPIGTLLVGLSLPEPTVAKAGRAIGINNTGDGFTDIAATIAAAAVSSYIATLIDDADAPAARTTLGLNMLRRTGITYDPASLTTGNETESGDITVTGAALGDSVLVFPPYNLQGIFCQGRVTASNTVRIRLRNGTGGTIDLANSAAWEVWVLKGGQS